jgi:predicted N-acetyltransferase YhbS
MIITTEQSHHGAAIERLLDVTFGLDRHQKSSYRLRDGIDPIAELCLVGLEHDDLGREKVMGTIRYWEVRAGDRAALLLGPIAVSPGLQGGGLGSKLIRLSLNKAAALGHRAVLLVGDAPYYERFGFTRRLALGLNMPAPTDPNRFLGLELQEGALRGAVGDVAVAEQEDDRRAFGRAGISGFAVGGVWYARPN